MHLYFATIPLEVLIMLTPRQIRLVEARDRTYRPGGFPDQIPHHESTTQEDESEIPARAPCPGGDRGSSSLAEEDESGW